jgi:hypothetical protein
VPRRAYDVAGSSRLSAPATPDARETPERRQRDAREERVRVLEA